MENKLCKQIGRFSAVAVGNNYFCLLDDKSKQRYKVKINNIERYDPYEMKKEELSGDISKFPPVTKEELKVYTQRFVVLPSVRIKMDLGSENKIVW